MSFDRRPRVGFVLEQALGHSAHARTFRRMLPQQQAVSAVLTEIPFEVAGSAARIPLFGTNWTVRSGLRARRAIRAMHREKPLEALFIHTQVPAVLNADWMSRIPTVVSLDATPLQYDELGSDYDHVPAHPRVERLKWRANKRCLEKAAHVVTWSQWAKSSVVDDYGIPDAKVTVVPPGVDLAWWAGGTPRPVDATPVRILFVGGDFDRKGGWEVLEAFRVLSSELPGRVALDVVTGLSLPAEAGVTVHNGLGPGDPQLRACFQGADIFCLPTRADCLGIVLLEAGAVGLPIVSTAVTAIPEVIEDGRTGFLVDPGDRSALVGALRRLVVDPALRKSIGRNGAAKAAKDYDAEKNLDRIAELLASIARRVDPH